jgi:hypothetical protein
MIRTARRRMEPMLDKIDGTNINSGFLAAMQKVG